MKEDFSRTLALLRQERGLSQRRAAEDLGVSQALLSHYENGLREPGLCFVVKACDYYNVSADFLLGRTLSRDGTTILDADSLFDATGRREHVLEGSVMATLSRKLIGNAVNVLFDLLGKLGNKAAIKAAANYLSMGVYTLYRHLHQASPDGKADIFSVSETRFRAGLAQADMILSGAEFAQALESRENEGKFPPMGHDEMLADYPGTYQALLQVVHVCGERLNRAMSAHSEQIK